MIALSELRREPWSSGYGRWLMIKRSWVGTPAQYTGWMLAMLAITEAQENNINKGSWMWNFKKIYKRNIIQTPFFTEWGQALEMWLAKTAYFDPIVQMIPLSVIPLSGPHCIDLRTQLTTTTLWTMGTFLCSKGWLLCTCL